MKFTQNVPIQIPTNVPPEKAIEAIKLGSELLAKVLGQLKTVDDFHGFLLGARSDGISVPPYEHLELDDLRAVAIKAWWARVERMLNEEMKYAGDTP